MLFIYFFVKFDEKFGTILVQYTEVFFYARVTKKISWRKKNGGFNYSGLAFFLHRPGVKKEYPEIY